MVFRVYKAELQKIITSYRFRIAILAVLVFSTYNILTSYTKFPRMLPLEGYFSRSLDNSVFDYYVWLPIPILFCSDIICGDKSKNIMYMQFATKTDKSIIYYSKYLAITTSMILVFILDLLFSCAFSVYLVGFKGSPKSMHCILDYSVVIIDMSLKQLILLKIFFGIITCFSAAVIFIFVSTLVVDFVTSYIISALLIINANSFYCAVDNGIGFSKYFIISFYCANHIDGPTDYDIKIGVISMIVQTVILYFWGLYIYKKIE